MNAPRIIPARPMGHGDILPLIREVGHLTERGHYDAAAELDAAIRQPITVAGRVLCPDDDQWSWYGYTKHTTLMLSVTRDAGAYHASADPVDARTIDGWQATMSANVPCGAMVSTAGFGPTIAAALADAQARYQAAIADTLLRMGALLREVG